MAAHPSDGEPSPAWRGVESAAALLGVPPRTLRRALDRNAKRAEGGAVTSETDGVRARKFGRLWRVWLDPGWLNPERKK